MTGVMTINYGSGGVVSMTKKAINAFTDACERIEDVRKELRDIGDHSSRRYLSSASAFLRKKTQQYESRITALSNFQTLAGNLMSNAEAADRRVADHMNDAITEFKAITGVSSGFLATLGKILKGVGEFALCVICPPYAMKKLWDNVGKPLVDSIKAFYERNKYLLDMLGNLVLAGLAVAGAIMAIAAVAAAATFGAAVIAVIGAVGAVIAATSAVINLVRSSNAYGAHLTGDDQTAEALRGMSAADYLGLATEAMWGWDADLVSNIYTGIEVVGLICNLVKGISTVRSLAGGIKDMGLIDSYKINGFWKTVGDNLLKPDMFKSAWSEARFFRSIWNLNSFGTAAAWCDIDNLVKSTSHVISTISLAKDLFGEKKVVKFTMEAAGLGEIYSIGEKVNAAIQN